MLLFARGAGVDTRGVRRRLRFLATSAVTVVVMVAVGFGGVAVADAPKDAEHFASFRNCDPVTGPGWETDHVGDGVVNLRFTIPRRTFIHEGPNGVSVATNTNEAPCVRDEVLSCSLDLLTCGPASEALRVRVLTADMPPVWPAPGTWISL